MNSQANPPSVEVVPVPAPASPASPVTPSGYTDDFIRGIDEAISRLHASIPAAPAASPDAGSGSDATRDAVAAMEALFKAGLPGGQLPPAAEPASHPS